VVTVSEDARPRMVVFGDTEFISNTAMRTEDRANNYSLFVSALEWMSEHENPRGIGPQPKTSEVVTMPMARAERGNAELRGRLLALQNDLWSLIRSEAIDAEREVQDA